MAKSFFDMVNTFSNTRDPGGGSLYKNKGKGGKGSRLSTGSLLTAAKKATTGAGGSSEG